MKPSILPLLAVTSLVLVQLFSCTKMNTLADSPDVLAEQEVMKQGDKIQKKYKTKSLPMDGLQEATPNNSPATGTFQITYHTDTKVLELDMSWKDLVGTVTASHIHGPASPGVNAPVIIPLFSLGQDTNPFEADLVTTSYASFDEAALLDGLYYINIHSSVYPGGEIRGQIVFK